MKNKQSQFDKVNVFQNSFGIYSFDELPLDIKSKIEKELINIIESDIKSMGLIFKSKSEFSHTRESYIKERLSCLTSKNFYANIQGVFYELNKIK